MEVPNDLLLALVQPVVKCHACRDTGGVHVPGYFNPVNGSGEPPSWTPCPARCEAYRRAVDDEEEDIAGTFVGQGRDI